MCPNDKNNNMKLCHVPYSDSAFVSCHRLKLPLVHLLIPAWRIKHLWLEMPSCRFPACLSIAKMKNVNQQRIVIDVNPSAVSRQKHLLLIFNPRNVKTNFPIWQFGGFINFVGLKKIPRRPTHANFKIKINRASKNCGEQVVRSSSVGISSAFGLSNFV